MSAFTKVEIGVSSLIEKMEYNSETQVLRVDFPNRKNPGSPGAQAEYKNVTPEIVSQLEHATDQPGGSAGKLFNATIKADPVAFPFHYTRE